MIGKFISTLAKQCSRILKQGGKPAVRGAYPTIRVDCDADLAPNLYWVGPSPVFLMPPEMLILQGAHRFTQNHPFVEAIRRGPEALEHFYTEFSPRNLAQMYRVPEKGLTGENLPPWELPWLLRERVPPGAEAGLGLEHGVSYYGPCTPQKITVEHQRLASVAGRIREEGYLPDKHGHIEGHFLQSGKHYRFFVRGGKHRAAALTYLGYERIPVRVRLTWPRIVLAGTQDDWPLVRSGEVDPQLATQIFDRYFHS